MKCPVCNVGQVQPGKTTLTLENDGVKLDVQGVPPMICANCGQETVSEEVKAKILKAVQEASAGNAPGGNA
ncbi:MAG: type II toxin-antitoxin system MqsA family antitoxin [Deltaproteobacteria bacterium]|nr:type II toxin-antitoxin system MqsA family antitoxin [Deltaproteobacteria bacterium]